MSGPRENIHIELQYRWTRGDAPQRPLSHPVVNMLRAVRDGGSVQAASQALAVSYRHAWGLLRNAEQEVGCELVHWIRGRRCVLTDKGAALVHAEDLALSRLAPQIESLRAELSQAFRAALGPSSLSLIMFASHDMALPALRDLAQRRGLHLDLRFTGSVDGLRALAARRCLIAGFHAPLAAPAGSGYARQLKPLLQPGVHKLIGFALRSQGLILARGNPLALCSVADMARPGVRFVSRQPGSCTRLLIDALLQQAGVELAPTVGLEQVEETHLAVAAAVACGAGDAGIGSEAAAHAFGLAFVPLARERYAFVCLKSDLDDPAVRALRTLLGESEWTQRLNAIAGCADDHGGAVLRLTEALPWWAELVAVPLQPVGLR